MRRGRRVGALATAAAGVLFAAAAVAACGDDDASDAAGPGPGPAEPAFRTTSTTIDLGGLPLEVPAGYTPIPAPAAGFGLAIPDGWQATLLTPEALERIASALGPDDAFVQAADRAADAGAILYAAGLDGDGRVTDAKLDVQAVDDVDAAILTLTDEIARQRDLVIDDVGGDPDADPPNVRIRYHLDNPGGDSGPDRAEGTQYLYAGDREVWSLIVTSEDPATHDATADTIAATFVLTPDP